MTWLEEMRAEHAQTRSEMADMRRDFTAILHGTEGRLSERIHQVELRVERRVSDLMKWSFVFWCGAVAAVAALAGVLRP